MCQGPSTTTSSNKSKKDPTAGVNQTTTQKGSNGSDNKSNTIEPSLLPNSSSWLETTLLGRVIFTVNAMMCIPMYFMNVCITTYLSLYFIVFKDHPWIRTVMAMYLMWGFFLDKRPHGRKSMVLATQIQPYWNKTWSVRNVAKYFHCQLHKTCDDLRTSQYGDDNNKNATVQKPNDKERYIFAYHPHGVIGMGGSMGLMTDACDFGNVFPEVPLRSGVTLNATFWAPFFREWLWSLGMCGANKATLQTRLQTESIVLIPGGAAEALYAHPYTMKLSLKNRKGFCKLAMQENVALVPCLGFGENEIFDTLVHHHHDDSSKTTTTTTTARLSIKHFLWTFQQWFKNVFTFSLPMWTNVIPNRVAITVVVGKPLRFTQTQTVDECHALYIQALTELYNTHKDQYGYGHVPLEFV